MKVILIKDVQSLGHSGDIKDVSDGYARNFLIPGGYAKPATQSALEKAEQIKAQKAKEAEGELGRAKELAKKLQGESVVVKAKADDSGKLYAAVKGEEISEALKAKGFEVEKNKVVIGDPIKELGEFEININLDHGLEVLIGVTVEKE